MDSPDRRCYIKLMISGQWKRVKEGMGKLFRKAGKDKSAYVRTTADKWGEKQIKEMAKLGSKLILM